MEETGWRLPLFFFFCLSAKRRRLICSPQTVSVQPVICTLKTKEGTKRKKEWNLTQSGFQLVTLVCSSKCRHFPSRKSTENNTSLPHLYSPPIDAGHHPQTLHAKECGEQKSFQSPEAAAFRRDAWLQFFFIPSRDVTPHTPITHPDHALNLLSSDRQTLACAAVLENN